MARNGQAGLRHRIGAAVAAPLRAVAACADFCRLARLARACGVAALLGSVSLLTVAPPAAAQDATWNLVGNGDFDNAGNWTPATVPTGTAFFDFTTLTQNSVTFSAAANTIGGFTFTPGSSDYTFAVLFTTLTFNGAGLVFNAGSGTAALGVRGGVVNFNNSSTAGSATIQTLGGTVNFNGASTAATATIENHGNLNFNGTSTAGSASIISTPFFAFLVHDPAFMTFNDSSTAGNASINNGGFITFKDSSTAANAILVNRPVTNRGFGGFQPVIQFENASSAGNAAITNDNGIISFANHSTAGNAAITNISVTPVMDGLGNIIHVSPVVDFSLSSGANGDGKISAGSIAGPGNFYLGADQLTVGGNNFSTTVAGVISDCGASNVACLNPGSAGGSLVKLGTGTLILSGANTYTGATTVGGGTLEVDGSIATSSLTTVANGALLTGTGAVGNLQVNNGAMFAPGASGVPGSSMTVSGNLTFQSGAQYFVFLNPSTSSFANVTGTASLNGTVDAVFAPGSYITKQYTILQSRGLNGTTFSNLNNINLAPGFSDSLSYSADAVFLNLIGVLGVGTPLNQNQRNVANALNNFFNNGGALPPGFASIFNLTGTDLANALTQLDGENATGAERSAFELMNEFLNLMLDPYLDGRMGGAADGPLGFAPDQEASLPPEIALAYAGVLKAPPGQTFAQRWTAWGTGFGGGATTKGDPVVGSNNVTTGTFGFAAGMDYHYSPDTVLGFALAGGGTSWNLAQGLGPGRSDAFLAGLYGVTHKGPAYLAGSLAFANNWFTTNRVALGDQLTASFQGQSYAGRLEGGYRFVLPAPSLPAHASGGGLGNRFGVTPYAAVQVQDFHTPSYGETDLTSGGFGLSYSAMTGTDTRSELGSRFDDRTVFNSMPLILRARLAWAHDWVSNPALSAGFESLPGTGFTVNGAPIPHDSALTSAGAQLFFTANCSLFAKFDGAFAKGSQTYAGSGTLRYTW